MIIYFEHLKEICCRLTIFFVIFFILSIIKKYGADYLNYWMYIDESGDLGKGGSKYIILSALVVKEPEKLDRIIKNMRRNKFKKELKKTNEIKASKSSPELRKYMLKKLNNIDYYIYYSALNLKECKNEFLNTNHHKKYNYVAGELAKSISFNCNSLDIRIDKSMGKQITRDDFNQYFEKNLQLNNSINKMFIYHSNSHSFSGLQFVDLIAWSIFRKYEIGDLQYYTIIEKNIKNSSKLY